MADDGMLLNFDLSGIAAPKQVKFKGGKWRDRNRAQRNAKRQQDGSSNPTDEAAQDRPSKRRRMEGGAGAADGAHGAGGSRPGQSRQWKPPGQSSDGGSGGGRPAMTARRDPQNGVTSRLFTSNPTALTDFRSAAAKAEAGEEVDGDAEADADADAEPVRASNAPLSEEAATFLALGLSRRVSQHLSTKLGLKAPTAIQNSAVPQLVAHDSDAFLQAETGSGKTLAYLLPLVQRILALSENDDGTKRGEEETDKKGNKSKPSHDKPLKIHRNSGLFAIVLAPTRELCKQISVVLEKLLRCAPWIVSTTVIGGESKKSEKARIRKGVNILIATPGRLTDHLDNTEVLDVGTVRWLVLDEGDRLMEMGFEDDIRTIVGKIRQRGLQDKSKDGVVWPRGVLPSRRVTVLCSATMKMNVQKLGEISLEDAVHVTASQTEAGARDGTGSGDNANTDALAFAAPSQLKQTYIVAPAKLRLVTLLGLLRSTFARKGSVMKAIIFISCADSVDFHFDLLRSPDNEEGEEALATKDSVHTVTTVGRAAYITSAANRTIVVHRLHGSLAQPVRTATLASFAQETNPALLVTTDIASRGLDVPDVDLVIEYDPAFAVADHLHRIGRTARAGRPGKAVLFLQPGCEEGYASLLKASSPSALTPQLYDSVLQAGFSAPFEVPKPPAQGDNDNENTIPADHDPSRQQSWSKRAEALQLHLEQRLLQRPPPVSGSNADKQQDASSSRKDKYKHKNKGSGKPVKVEVKDSKLLDAARQAFRSHIRAYATHVREERVYFDITQLHLGHTAKSFGLREAPGGIGGGVQRRTKRPASGPAAKSSHAPASRSHGGGNNSDDEQTGGVDEDAARRMRQKMQAVMSASAEFNIG